MFSNLNEKVLANYLNRYIKENNLTLEFVAKKSNSSLSTVKNLCSGKTENPGILNALPIIYAVGGTPEEMIFGEEQDVVKEFSIDSIKEMCEQAIAELTKTNEAHIANIRAHYEQHRDDVTHNYERLLFEKEQQTKLFKKIAFVCFTMACIGFSILIILLILEVSNPNLGWIKF